MADDKDHRASRASTDGVTSVEDTERAIDAKNVTAPEALELGDGNRQDLERDAELGIDEKKATVDPNVVDWDGPDDPKNPMNWSEKHKWTIIGVVSAITFVS